MGGALVTVLAWATAPASAAQVATKTVRFRGASVTVPASWPVHDLTAQPGLCVRFDRPAVYLGRPSGQQRCPATALGRPQAVLIEPWGGRAVILRRASDTIAGGGPEARSAGGRAHPAAATFTGQGFDACSAPSSFTMSRWQASPYRGIGVYIGGTNMACSQPNLTPSWVSSQTAAGWHFILTYVGLQAPGNSCGCAGISPGQAAGQGQAAADDAVSRATALGLGPGNPIYFDMEAYSRTSANTSAVMNFLAAWTQRLHADGYTSGVYSSSGSGVSDLVARYGGAYPEPDDIWFAEWNGSRSTTSSYISGADWSAHQRLHQYQGDHNESYGGATLNIDGDALDGATATAGGSPAIADGTFIQLSSTGQIFRMAGGAPLYVSDWSAVGGPQPTTPVSDQQFAILSPVPADGTFLSTASGSLYRVVGGTAFPITQPALFPNARPIEVDSWDLNNPDEPLAHLSSTPADGTVVRGYPSPTYWTFTQGQRHRTTRRPAVGVDDAGLAQFPMQACVVPKLRRMTLTQVRSTLAQTDCLLGEVIRRHKPRRGHSLHVLRQFPGPNAQRLALATVTVILA